MHYKGYVIAESYGHGKAVSGTKLTSTIQVREPCPTGYYLKAQIRFTVHDIEEKRKAIEKAKALVDGLMSIKNSLKKY